MIEVHRVTPRLPPLCNLTEVSVSAHNLGGICTAAK